MPKTTIYCGPVRSGKSAEVLRRYREACRADGRRAMLLLPDTNQVELARRRLVLDEGLPGLWQPRILTFPDLASEILKNTGTPAPQLSTVGERSLVRLVLRRLDDWLRAFAGVKQYPGFVEALCDFIGELKRAGMEPAAFEACLRRAGIWGAREMELARLFRDYQHLVHDLGVFDVEGRFWLARDLLESHESPIEWPAELYVDGFENFTTTQLEMLEALSQHAETVLVTLTYDANDSRKDLFEVTGRTLEKLLGCLRGAEVARACHSPRSGPLGLLASGLFGSSPARIAPGEAVRIIEAPGRRREVEAIGRRIKDLLIGGTRPESIGVLFRSLEDYGDLIREVFSKFGIPIRMGQWISAEGQTVCRTVLSLLRIVQRDFRLTDVVQFLNSSYVRFDPLESQDRDGEAPAFTPDDLAEIARRARIVGGRAEWVPRIELAVRRWQAAISQDETSSEDERPESRKELEERVRRGALAVRYIDSFIGKLQALPAEATHEGFVSAVLGLVRYFQIPSHLTDRLGPDASSANVHAFRELMTVLRDLAFDGQLLQEAEGRPVTITFPEFLRDLRTALGHAVFQAEGSRLGRVNVMEAHQARQLTFEHVFVGGLAEKEFPRARQEDVFYRDRERRRLVRSGIMLEERLPQQRDEAMLFYGAACAAEKRLTLSYPVTNAEGKEVLTSWYVDEVRKCFEGEINTTRVRLSEVVPDYPAVTRPVELMERAFLDGQPQLLQDQVSRWAGPALAPPRLADAYLNARAGADCESRRESPDAFDQYDGVVVSEHLLARLQSQFGAEHRFSAHQINSAGNCPFQYFASYVLNLTPQEEVTEEADNLERGRAFHAILAASFREAQEPGALGTSRVTPENLDAVKALVGRKAAQYFAQREAMGLVSDRALWKVERMVILRHLMSVVDFECEANEEDEACGEGYSPSNLEYVFGDRGGPPIRIDDPTGEIVIEGRIDRVDVRADAGQVAAYRIWDYKLGRAHHPGNALKGTDFQLPIYAFAAKQNLFEGPAQCERAGYYTVVRPIKRTAALAKPGPRQTALGDVLRETARQIPSVIRGIRQGRFPVSPTSFGACRFCDYRSLCRVNRFRVMRKSSRSAE